MLVDAHTHLDQYKENEIGGVIEEINRNKILTLSNSMDIESYFKNLEISCKSKFIIPSFGIHPWKALDYYNKLDILEEHIYNSKIIGEIGLDFYWTDNSLENKEAQIKVFEFFLHRAKKEDKFINIHTKGAEKEILESLYKFKIDKAIIHWYSGPFDILYKLIDRGYFFTISSQVIYSDQIKSVAKAIPIEKLLTETDNPGGEEWLSGRRGRPLLIREVLNGLSEIRDYSIEEMEKIIEKNISIVLLNNN